MQHRHLAELEELYVFLERFGYCVGGLEFLADQAIAHHEAPHMRILQAAKEHVSRLDANADAGVLLVGEKLIGVVSSNPIFFR